ncbi:hypothetical protein K7N18_05115 [Burkholderia arboris]|uniref:hypothetical protein n=1 Tax=Burkholderia arboris TaxID=488730 RepID=UPI001CA4261E|nr:hypothetical protein [Burkholderia arboris]MBY8604207.1 hypothetical protein [Burkholderia arboris]
MTDRTCQVRQPAPRINASNTARRQTIDAVNSGRKCNGLSMDNRRDSHHLVKIIKDEFKGPPPAMQLKELRRGIEFLSYAFIVAVVTLFVIGPLNFQRDIIAPLKAML